jgi:hypothetical protein
MTESEEKPSYEWECFQVLAYELPGDAPSEAERKIRARLRRKRLGTYDQSRIDDLRKLKNLLQLEISERGQQSRYYSGSTAATADFADFRMDEMAQDFSRQFPSIPGIEVRLSRPHRG